MDRMRIKATIEYVGEAFCGFQAQGPELLTVQGELERGLAVVLGSWSKKHGLEALPVPKITGSGRTDAGVHARGQVVSFDWPEAAGTDLGRLTAALNGITSPALTVHRVEQVENDFDARLSPHIKLYSYRLKLAKNSYGLEHNRAWHVGSRLNLPLMIKAARLFSGQHDFSAFRAADCTAKSTVRTILTSELGRIDAPTAAVLFEGRGFLKQMVRIAVGTIVACGRGELSIADIQALIDGGQRKDAGTTAPAGGLTLEWVRYLNQDYF